MSERVDRRPDRFMPPAKQRRGEVLPYDIRYDPRLGIPTVKTKVWAMASGPISTTEVGDNGTGHLDVGGWRYLIIDKKPTNPPSPMNKDNKDYGRVLRGKFSLKATSRDGLKRKEDEVADFDGTPIVIGILHE